MGEIEALGRSLPRRQLHGPRSAAEFEGERRDMSPLHFLGGYRAALAVRQVEAVAGIGNEDHVPAHVRAGSHRRRHAHVGGDAECDDMPGPEPLQAEVEVGADEGGVDAFAD